MYDQIGQDTLYIVLYAVVTVTALQASCYLLYENDYSFFYKNLQENVAKRVAAYLAK